MKLLEQILNHFEWCPHKKGIFTSGHQEKMTEVKIYRQSSRFTGGRPRGNPSINLSLLLCVHRAQGIGERVGVDVVCVWWWQGRSPGEVFSKCSRLEIGGCFPTITQDFSVAISNGVVWPFQEPWRLAGLCSVLLWLWMHKVGLALVAVIKWIPPLELNGGLSDQLFSLESSRKFPWTDLAKHFRGKGDCYFLCLAGHTEFCGGILVPDDSSGLVLKQFLRSNSHLSCCIV